jgi:phosphatidylglycerophosphatase C
MVMTTTESQMSQIGAGPSRVGPIVAFDFDGTLTVRDSFRAFLRWRGGAGDYYAGMARMAPAAFSYLFDRNLTALKAAMVRVWLSGLPRKVLEAEAAEFAAVAAPLLLRPDALKVWRRHRAEGARMVIVTASPEVIVAPFARGLGAELILGTRLVYDADDRVSGDIDGRNCRGPEKVRRLKDALGPDVVIAAAYGDTEGDREMLDFAEESFLRLFTGVPVPTVGAP